MKRPTQRGQLHSRRSTFSQHASTSQALSSQKRSHHVSQLSQTDSVVPETISPSIAGEGQSLSDDQQDLGDHDMNDMEQQLERSADGSQSTRHRETAVRIARRYKKRMGIHQYDVPNQTELMVVKCNTFEQPIGKTATKVSTEIGIIARDGSKAKFSFQNCTEKTKRWVQAKARDSWKQWKHYLFMEYHSYDRPIEQQYEHTDDGVDKAQWRKLVDYWRSENFKKVSAQNKANRAQLKMIHR